VHLRRWVCEPQVHLFKLLLERLHSYLQSRLGNSTLFGIYLISEINGEEFRSAARNSSLLMVWKEDVLPIIWHDYPFEVCAQVDFESGDALSNSTGGLYFGYVGEFSSSSDSYIYGRRLHAGGSWVELDGFDICRGAPNMRFVAKP
jgi:hypothetical protein